MRNATLTFICTVVLAGTVLGAGAAAAGATGYEDACSVHEAKHRVKRAERDLVRAKARLKEARHVLDATRYETDQYGHAVGRWVWLARDVDWPWHAVPQLMHVINRESSGDPQAKNPTSTASGLLQFLSGWWAGKWDPFDPRTNLYKGRRAWEQVGWAPWAATAY